MKDIDDNNAPQEMGLVCVAQIAKDINPDNFVLLPKDALDSKPYLIDHARVYERYVVNNYMAVIEFNRNVDKRKLVATAHNEDTLEAIWDVPKDTKGKRIKDLPPDTFLPWTDQFKPDNIPNLVTQTLPKAVQHTFKRPPSKTF